jgi:hypothetical protein
MRKSSCCANLPLPFLFASWKCFLLMLLLLWQCDSSQVPLACQLKEDSTRYFNVARDLGCCCNDHITWKDLDQHFVAPHLSAIDISMMKFWTFLFWIWTPRWKEEKMHETVCNNPKFIATISKAFFKNLKLKLWLK